MIRPRIFIDTSVIGGCLDDEFDFTSRLLFSEFREGRAVAVVSSLTLEELDLAPPEVKALLPELPEGSVEYVDLDDDAARLADNYVADGVVGQGSLADARQVAIATVNKVDVIVSWNFRHIVNLGRIRLFTATNLKHGLATPEIRSPLEVLSQDDQEV
jgi:hypothetical protein